jgi:hypothetical protein
LIAAGVDHTCALLNTGVVNCWGDNADGQLGNNSRTDSLVPVAVDAFTDGASAVSIAAGRDHTCALLNTGVVNCWGKNNFGQLGNNSTETSSVPVKVTSVTVPGVPTAVSATAGNGRATVVWTAPVSDGGSEISGYTVTSSPDNKTCTTTGASTCTVTGLTNGTSYTFAVISINDQGNSPASTESGAVTPVAPMVQSVSPGRVLESRSGLAYQTVDDLFEGVGRVGAGQVAELKVTGRAGVPDDAEAVFLNVVAVNPSGPGYLTVFPCGSTAPLAANVNYSGGDIAANAVLAKVGDGGKICVFTLAATDLVIDVNGFTPAAIG